MSRKPLEFHIKSDDYFGTLATILSLIRQNIEKEENRGVNIKTLKKAEKDLICLQGNYNIVKKL